MAKLKLTDEMIANAVKGIEEGNYACTVALALGISERSFWRWLEKGEKANSGIYSRFWHAIKKAEGIREKELLGIIRKAANRNWQAAAWMLERMAPEKFGRRERIQHEGVEDKPITVRWVTTNQNAGNTS